MAASHSDALVVFGVTGDLAHKMIFPALYAMVKRGDLKVPVLGVALPKWSLERLHKRVTDSIRRSGGIDDRRALNHLLSLLKYASGDYQDPNTFAAIKTALDKARRPAYYLAIPPSLFETVIKGLGAAKSEDFGVEDRGSFYESAGCLRDVVENHLFQVVALLAMEPPSSRDFGAVHTEKAKIFQAMPPLQRDDLVRGQYAGYRKEPGVAKNSDVDLPDTATEVLVELKAPPQALFAGSAPATGRTNYVRFRLSPSAAIALAARVELAGKEFVGEIAGGRRRLTRSSPQTVVGTIPNPMKHPDEGP